MKKAKGSLTLETALVLPIFLSLAISLISILEMMNLYSKVEFALHETAREVALFTYPAVYITETGKEIFETEEDFEMPDTDILNPIISETVIRAIFTEKFGINNLKNSLIKHGEAGIFFFRSEINDEDGNVDLIVTYKVSPLFNLFGIGDMTFSNRAKMHSWTGYTIHGDDNEDEYVYITDNASVYHTHRYCTHLRLTINTVLLSEIESYRNKDGKKYYACQKCAKKNKGENPEFVYITPYGESYHTSLSCSGLKRTIYKVRLSDVSGKKKCERCSTYVEGIIKGDDENESDGND